MSEQHSFAGDTNVAHREFAINPLAEIYPLMEEADFDKLVKDIKENGISIPIQLDAEGRIVDGRNRYNAAKACGATILVNRNPDLTTDEQVLEFIIRMNERRRHMTRKSRDAVIRDLYVQGKTTREIAKLTGTSQSTASRRKQRKSSDGGSSTESNDSADTPSKKRRKYCRLDESTKEKIVELKGKGQSNKAIAEELKVSPNTVSRTLKQLDDDQQPEEEHGGVADQQSDADPDREDVGASESTDEDNLIENQGSEDVVYDLDESIDALETNDIEWFLKTVNGFVDEREQSWSDVEKAKVCDVLKGIINRLEFVSEEPSPVETEAEHALVSV